jgi:hypothetical protein
LVVESVDALRSPVALRELFNCFLGTQQALLAGDFKVQRFPGDLSLAQIGVHALREIPFCVVDEC